MTHATQGPKGAHDETVRRQVLERFQAIDDTPRDRKAEATIIMEEKASVLFHAVAVSNSPRLGGLLGLRGEKVPGGTIYPLKCEEFGVQERPGNGDPRGNRFDGVFLGRYPGREEFGEAHPYGPWDRSAREVGRGYLLPFWRNPLFRICARLGRFRRPGDLIQHFGCEPSPYSPLELPGGRVHPPFRIPRTGCPRTMTNVSLYVARAAWRKHCPQSLAPADRIQWYIREFLFDRLRDGLDEKEGWRAQFGDFWVPLIAFRNESGVPVQHVLKLFDERRQRKLLVPVSEFEEDGVLRPCRYCVPSIESQSLYNADLLLKRPDAPVLLFDTPELARVNQHKSRCVCTAFLCDEGRYDQVDWSLLEGRDVYIVVTNHSGISLQEACFRAEALAEHLASEDVIGANPRFLQVKIDYPESRIRYDSLGELVSHLSSEKPKVDADSVRVMGGEEFRKVLAAARDSVANPFHLVGQADRTDDIVEAPAVGPGRDIMLRPVLERGAVSLLHGMQSSGKTALLYSIAGAVISGEALFPGRWWTVPKWCKGAVVVYLDFETGGGKVEGRKQSFLYPYLSPKKEVRKEQESRFRHVALRGHDIDYSQPENHEKLLELVEEQIRDVKPGTPVLVMIDTFRNLIGGHENNCDWARVKPLLYRIAGSERALLVSHHSNAQKKSSGSLDKLRDVDYVFSVEEIKGVAKGNLKMPRQILVEKTREGGISSDMQEFAVSYCTGKKDGDLLDGGKGKRFWQMVAMEISGALPDNCMEIVRDGHPGEWTVISRDGHPGFDYLQGLVNEYRGLTPPWAAGDLYSLFGISNGWFYNSGLKMPKAEQSDD